MVQSLSEKSEVTALKLIIKGTGKKIMQPVFARSVSTPSMLDLTNFQGIYLVQNRNKDDDKIRAAT